MDPSKLIKTILFWLAIILVSVFLWRLVTARNETVLEMKYSQFLSHVDNDEVRDLTISLSVETADVRGYLQKSGDRFHVAVPRESLPDLIVQLRNNQVSVDINGKPKNDWVAFLLNAAPLLLLVGFWIFMMRRLTPRKGGPGNPTS